MWGRVRGWAAREWSVGVIAASALLIGIGYGSAFLPGGVPGWGPWAFVGGTSLILVGTMALGAARDGQLGVLWIPFGLVLLILVAGFGTVLALPPASPEDPDLWLGLPPRAAVILYGIGFLPYLILPVAYAWTFDRLTLEPGDLERIRDRALAARGEIPLVPGRRGDEDSIPDGRVGGETG